MKRALLSLFAAGYASFALAQTVPFPARSGESGLMDVPDAEIAGVSRGLLGAEFRFDSISGASPDFGPLPLYAVGGLTERIEIGLTAREWGQPGDPRPARTLFGGAAKLQLLPPAGSIPGVAVDIVADRVNRDAVYGSRLIVSTDRSKAMRISAFAGGEAGGEKGLTYGGALALAYGPRGDLVLEALGGPRGANYGAAVRWRAAPAVGVSIGFNYLPGEDGVRFSLGLGFGPSRKTEPTIAAPEPAVAPEPEAEPTALAFLDDRPHFRLRIRLADPSGATARSLRHGPRSVSVSAGPGRTAAPALRAAAPNMEDLAEAQLREQEALADAREKRVRGAAEQLGAREKAVREETTRLAEREGELAEREQQLDGRERRGAFRGPATPQQRELESLEAQLASQERNLSAQERSFGPALDAAEGRERDAAAREDGERQEANRLAASVSGSTSRALQVEIRKQALGARNRQLAALEARLLAKGERIDALERQLRAKGERLDAWQRRLDTRSDRIDLLERLSAEAKAPTTAPGPSGAPKTAPAKDKPVFVMVVKSPTAIVKERAAARSVQPAGPALQAGVAVEKAVAAATIVLFPTPASEISELDGETIDGIAKLAANEGCELLIWARAKDPSLTAEAQRRANDIRTRVLASGPLDPKQIVTRITTRPGAQAVDVVVSALRESAKAAAPGTAAPASAALLTGESGKRQIREAVQAAQPSIEACVGEIIEQKRLQRAEGILKLTVSSTGSIGKVVAGEGDLAGGRLEECLKAASGAWRFPHAEAEYVVDVPITVIRGGTR